MIRVSLWIRHTVVSLARVSAADNEVEICATIKAGSNVVQVYGFCVDAPDGKVRIVMELCGHGSLRAHLKALPPEKVPYLASN